MLSKNVERHLDNVKDITAFEIIISVPHENWIFNIFFFLLSKLYDIFMSQDEQMYWHVQHLYTCIQDYTYITTFSDSYTREFKNETRFYCEC